MNSSRLFLLISLSCYVLFAGMAWAEERPSILFLLVDDQRNDTLGCAGHPIVKTPVIDSLAENGVRFENAFVTTSICAASRASILTGLYERTHGYTFKTPPLRNELMLQSYPALLKNAGYRTGMIGKYGVQAEGKPEADMFDYFRTLRYGLVKEKGGGKRHETEIAGDLAIKFLKESPADQPFCLSVSFHAVHAVDGDKTPGYGHYPWIKAVDGMYDDITLPEPRLSDPAIFENHPEFLKSGLNRQRYYWRWDTPEKYQANMKGYFRMISGVDYTIGRIRKQLEKQGLAENTVIIYMGDNGYYMGDRGFAGKWSHYEQSLRIPMIIYDPRQPEKWQGIVSDEKVLNIDVPFTMLELASVQVPEHYQGRSLVPLTEGREVADWRDDFFCEHLMDQKGIPKWEGVRGNRYVYACYFEQNPPFEFLHDLKADPNQLVNLVGNPEYAEVLKQMRKRCDVLKSRHAVERN